MIIELRYSTRVMVQFPVELWYDGHRVAVVYENYGTISSGAKAQFPVELWHYDYKPPVAGRQLLHHKIHTKIFTFTNKYNTFGRTSSPT